MIVRSDDKILGIISIWFSVLFSFSLASNINEPYLILLRGLGAAVLCMTSVVVFIVLIKQVTGTDEVSRNDC